MDDRKMQIIQQLMDELQSEMKMDGDELSDRLGRKKPGLEVVKLEGKSDGDPMLESAEDKLGMDSGDMDDDLDMMDPKEKLKARLMRLRG